MTGEPEFTLGIEEEYHLVDRASRDLVDDPPPAMLAECESLLAGQVSPEFLRSQIEVAHARTILTRGTSAHAQRRVFEAALAAGASRAEALKAVVDWLIEETRRDL